MTSPAPSPGPGRQRVRRVERPPTKRVAPASALSGPPARTVTGGTVAWFVVLAAMAVVQLDRRAWFDSAVLLTVLVVLVVDLSGRLPHGALTVSGTGPAVIGAALLAGVVLVLAPRHGTVAGLVLVVLGAAALAYAWPDRRENDPAVLDREPWDRATTRTAAAWAAAWIAGCLWELAMFLLGQGRTGSSNPYPAASDLLDPLLANPVVKALFVVVWLSAGVGLLARMDRR